MCVQGGAVDSEGKLAVKASDAAFLLPAGTIGNALGIIIELLSASLGAGDPRLRSAPPEKVPDGEPVRPSRVEHSSVTRVEGREDVAAFWSCCCLASRCCCVMAAVRHGWLS